MCNYDVMTSANVTFNDVTSRNASDVSNKNQDTVNRQNMEIRTFY